MKARLALVVVAVLAMWAVKRHYADARVDDLRWMLAPTARLVTATTGATFTVAPGEGYFSRERLFLIEKSCAGINFLIAAFGMVVFTLGPRAQGWLAAARALVVSALASYAAAILVNAARITIAMWIAGAGVPGLSAAAVHRLEGIIVYFVGLALLHELVRRPSAGSFARRWAWPLTCYYAVTLGVPLLNGSGGSASFARHAAVVLVVPVLLIGLAWAVHAGVISHLYGHEKPGSDRAVDGGAGADGNGRHAAGRHVGAAAHA